MTDHQREPAPSAGAAVGGKLAESQSPPGSETNERPKRPRAAVCAMARTALQGGNLPGEIVRRRNLIMHEKLPASGADDCRGEARSAEFEGMFADGVTDFAISGKAILRRETVA